MSKVTNTKVFFFLLRTGLFGRKPGDSDIFPEKLPSSMLEDIFKLAALHNVQILIGDGLEESRDVFVSDATVDMYLDAIASAREDLIRRNRHVAEIAKLATAMYPDSWIFKGVKTACHYRHPLHRGKGDIDLVRSDIKREYEEKLDVVDGQLIPSTSKDAVTVEHHFYPEYLYNPFLHRSLMKDISTDNPAQHGGLSPEMNLLCLLLHIRRHLLTTGIGIKHICDIAVLLSSQEYDSERMAYLFQKYEMDTFCSNLAMFLSRFFHVEAAFMKKEGSSPKEYDLLKHVILTEGYHKSDVDVHTKRTFVASVKGRWSRCRRMRNLVGSEALWMLPKQVIFRLQH